MSIDFSGVVNDSLDAVYQYEVARQEVSRLSKEIRSNARCLRSDRNTCIEDHWGIRMQENLRDHLESMVYEDELCSACTTLNTLVQSRKKARKVLGKTKRRLSCVGKRIIKGVE